MGSWKEKCFCRRKSVSYGIIDECLIGRTSKKKRMKDLEDMMLEFLGQLDGNALLWIQETIRNDFLTPIMVFITNLGNSGAIWIAITALLLVFKKTRIVGLMSAIALLGALIVDNLLLKNIIARTRPYEVVEGLQRIIAAQKDYSFPSGHTGSSFASAVVLYKEMPKKYGIPAVIFATVMGLSRLYVGVHYPSDVISGALIGTMIAVCVHRYIYMKMPEVNLS